MLIIMFVVGTIFGSFFGLIGSRVPINESIVKPRSHCEKCKHQLSFSELIPIISFIILKGRCKECKDKLSLIYPLIEIISGISYMIAYLVFGLTIDIIIPLTFISMMLIIIVSDYKYMIIPDSILVIFGILLGVEILVIYGPVILLKHILAGFGAFILMFGLKKLGDFLFKKESMGGGDIKLMFIIGLVIGLPMAILSVFIGSIIAFPYALIVMKKNSSHILPFGPFIALGSIIIILNKINFDVLKNFLMNI